MPSLNRADYLVSETELSVEISDDFHVFHQLLSQGGRYLPLFEELYLHRLACVDHDYSCCETHAIGLFRKERPHVLWLGPRDKMYMGLLDSEDFFPASNALFKERPTVEE